LKDLVEDAQKDPEIFLGVPLEGQWYDFGARKFFKAAGWMWREPNL